MSRQRLLLFGFCFLILVHSSLLAVRAQSASATLSGTVIDQNGASVPGVDISVVNEATAIERTAKTGGNGEFAIPLLPPASYVLTARREGFSPVKIAVLLNVGDQKGLQIQLKAGDVNAQVTVDSNADTVRTDAAVATVVDQQFVSNIPLNGRSFQTLIALTPGVTIAPSSTARPGQFSVNGQRTNANYFQVDGVSANFGINTVSGNGDGVVGALPALTAAGGRMDWSRLMPLKSLRCRLRTTPLSMGECLVVRYRS